MNPKRFIETIKSSFIAFMLTNSIKGKPIATRNETIPHKPNFVESAVSND